MRKYIKIVINTTIFICSAVYLSLICYDKDFLDEKIIQSPSDRSIYFKKDTIDQLNCIKKDLESKKVFMTDYTKEITSESINLLIEIKKRTDLISGYIMGQNTRLPKETAVREAAAFLRYSYEYDIPLDLVVGVANTESHFKPGARSNHGSAGVMQVTWRVHYRLLQSEGIMSEEDLHDPAFGIKAGCVLISRYIKKYKNVKKAMGRYYGGSANVYWRRISRNMNKFRKYEKARTVIE